MIFIKFLRTSGQDEVILPITKYTFGSAGYDLHSPRSYLIQPGETRVIPTAIEICNMPINIEAQIRSKSGLATLGIIVLNAPGTIDSDYKGEIFVILHNVSKLERIIKPAQSIAQIVFSSIYSETISGEVLYKEAYRKGGLGSTTE